MVQAPEQRSPVRGAKLWPMSVEAYHLLGEAGAVAEDTELLYGLVYEKMPKTPYHSFLLRRLFRMLEELDLPNFFVSAEQPLTFLDSEPEPDIAIIKGRNEDYRERHPRTAEVVIEICVTSHDYDRSKLRAYASANVKECWLVLGPEKQVQVFRDPKDGAYQHTLLHGPGGSVQSAILPKVTVDLTALFAN